jgi:hypothetical protein
LNTPSAIGERQMLPVQTNSTRYDRGGPAWRVREFVLEDISASSAAGSGYGSSLVFGYDSAPMRPARQICRLVVAAQLAASLAANAAESGLITPGDVLMVQFSPYALHFENGPDHTGHPWLIGVEWQGKSRWLAGFSYFNNTFDQKCEYIYGGYTFSLGETFKNWYIKVTGGLIIGYKEPFEDKLPVNWNGVAPVILPGLGYKFERFNVQINVLGANGFIFTFGYDLLR